MGTIAIGPAFWVLCALAFAAAVAYGGYFLARPPSFVRALVKTIFMGAATGALISAGAPFPLIAAAFFSALGDLFLAFKAKWTLPLGILAFLFAQLTYVVLFGAIWLFSGDNAPLWPRYLAMAAIAVFLLAFLVWFWRTDEFKRAPVSGALTVALLIGVGALLPVYIIASTIALNTDPESSPSLTAFAPLTALAFAAIGLAIWRRKLGAVPLVAMIYAGAITTMAIAAMWLPWIGWLTMFGAVSFLVSDLVLAAELFRLPADAPVRRLTAPVVWWTYVAAQAFIVAGVISIVRAE